MPAGSRGGARGGSRFVVAVGGDGTVHEVVNGMIGWAARWPPPTVRCSGSWAAGSGSDFIRTFGLPGDASRACYHLTGDNTYLLDVGAITYTTVAGDTDTRYFVNVAEAGSGRRWPPAPNACPRGSDRRSTSSASGAPCPGSGSRPSACKTGRGVRGPAFLVVVGNGQYYGGGMKISPRSYPGDGVLDVLIFKGPKTDAFTLLPRIYRGEHIPHDHIEELRVRRSLTVEADRPLPIEADGEILGTTRATFDVVPQALRMKL